jgi:hypothetical protein
VALRLHLWLVRRAVRLRQVGKLCPDDGQRLFLEDRRLLQGNRPDDAEVPVHGQVAKRADLPPRHVGVPVAKVVRERACDLTEQQRPVQHGVTQDPVGIPALAGHPVEVARALSTRSATRPG